MSTGPTAEEWEQVDDVHQQRQYAAQLRELNDLEKTYHALRHNVHTVRKALGVTPSVEEVMAQAKARAG